MFKRIHIENFKSLTKIDFDLCKGKKPKQHVFVYGENGSGKSNLVDVFTFLKKSTNSLTITQELLNFPDKGTYVELFEQIKGLYFTDFDKGNFKTINSAANMILNFVFTIKDKDFEYEMVFNDKELIEESLSGVININKVLLYKISKIDETINTNIHPELISKQYRPDFNLELSKYFGKHTLLAILNNANRHLNEAFIEANISSLLLEPLIYINKINSPNSAIDNLIYPADKCGLLIPLEQGTIKKGDYETLRKTEHILQYFFSSISSDIKNARYKLTSEASNEARENYQLMFERQVGKEVVMIPYNLESNGVKKILSLLPRIINYLDGNVVVIDEMDSKIHDLLMVEIIEKLLGAKSKGQLIVTTHNTLLLEVLNKDDTYFLSTEIDGTKKLLCATDYHFRIQNNHNVRKLYLAGSFQAIPYTGFVDFDLLLEKRDEK